MTDTAHPFADRPPTIGALFLARVTATPTKLAYLYPDQNESWVRRTWEQTRQQVWEIGAGLLALGLQPEERVALASSTRIEWVLVDLGINCAGGATTAIYPNLQGPEFAHIVTHSASAYFVAENPEQVAKLADLADSEQVRTVILIDGEPTDDRTITLDQLKERGRAHLEANPTAMEDAIASTQPEAIATLIYTSGTTGLPKGVELLHSNWTYEAASLDSLDLITPDSLQYFWLPLSHVFGKAVMVAQLTIGFASAVDGRLDRIMPGLAATRPTFMCGAPRIFEKVRNAVKLSSAGSPLKRSIASWAFSVGKKSQPYRLEGQPMPRALAAQYRIADRLVFSKLKERMGGNIQFFVSGSAKLSAQVQAWFYSAGIVVIEGYGMTETAAVSTVNHPSTPRFGTVGPGIPGTEIRIADDGEVMIRGGGVMRGYHKDPERTAEVLDADGWYATGDIGELDADGYLRITDRKKDLMKTSAGKYVAPQKVEGALAANMPLASQVVAVGDGRKYISALIALDPAALTGWAERNDHAGLSYAELVGLPDLQETIQADVDAGNAKLERWETVKRFALLDHELTVESGDVTANMKLRRSAIADRYADIVDTLYEAEPDD
ncbi:MAG: AMP-dependent synthetase/ligase [Propioniciclava sp.]